MDCMLLASSSRGMTDSTESYSLENITVQAKPQRFRTGRRGRAGYEPGSADAVASAVINKAWDEESRKIDEELRIAEVEGGDDQKIDSDSKITSMPTRPTRDPSANPVMLRTGNTSREKKFEFLEHTADIQIHAWGNNFAEALENTGLGMFSYMSDLSRVSSVPELTQTIHVTATDDEQLLFKFLDEILYLFLGSKIVVCNLRIISLESTAAGKPSSSLKVIVEGELFGPQHERGTEVKAITYSNAQILYDKEEDLVEIFCIVDI